MRKWLVLVVFVGLVIVVRAKSQGTGYSPPEQTHFSAEDEAVNKPVAIPNDVLAILSEDRMVSNVMKHADDAPKEPPLSWFSVSVIHLGAPGEQDLIVEAQDSLRGANVNMFWVFQTTAAGHQLILAAPAHDLIVMKTRWMGYREIEISAETAVVFTSVLLRWDGKKYSKFKVKSQNM